jgi:lipid II:glycine glycyltransferase (peptidoglycan interpeptide bridge formation enzyme)
MSFEKIQLTSELIDSDFFVLSKGNSLVLASAIVFHITPEIVQVIYWGDLPEFNNYKTMNYLSYKVFEHYKNINKKIVDIGPSTENSIPNYGLCEFKESIGCNIDSKFSFKLII